jgi:hypothetical protein
MKNYPLTKAKLLPLATILFFLCLWEAGVR